MAEKALENAKDIDSGEVMEIYDRHTMTAIYSSCDKIEEKLYLGDWLTVRDRELLKDLNIKRVLSIVNFDIEQYNDIIYKQIVVEDVQWEDLLTRFPECIQFITDGHNSGQNVLVHCAAGISRSATVVIAFLMHKYKIHYETARELVSKERKIAPNPGFVDQLKLFELMNYTIDVNRKEYIDYLTDIRERKLKFILNF